ncbi:hypothetical protein [Yoonia maritima]|uniref:hypothetical protein n=1 Tax=Yoonia maritima TaxID=1435347 RepID=UPI0037367D65
MDPYSAIDKQLVVPGARPEPSADEEITLVVGAAKRLAFAERMPREPGCRLS